MALHFCDKVIIIIFIFHFIFNVFWSPIFGFKVSNKVQQEYSIHIVFI